MVIEKIRIKELIEDNEIDCGGKGIMIKLRKKRFIKDMKKEEAFYFGYDLALQNLLDN